MRWLCLLFLLSSLSCTVRGGWPRFLRPGEASDSAIRKEQAARDNAVADLQSQLARRDTEILDLEAVGKALVSKWGKSAALWAVYNAWPAGAPISKACDVLWLQDQPARVRDVAWMVCFKDQWQ
jgi:hypothetical protein